MFAACGLHISGPQIETVPGTTVRGSDHGDIEVVEPTAATNGYLLVSQGILSRDFYVPFDTVVHFAENEVFINVPKPAVADMPWSYAASRQRRLVNFDPAAKQVEKLYASHVPSSDILRHR